MLNVNKNAGCAGNRVASGTGQGRGKLRSDRQNPSIFFYHPKWILLHFAASCRKHTKRLTTLILLAILCSQCLRENCDSGFKSRRPDHFIPPPFPASG